MTDKRARVSDADRGLCNFHLEEGEGVARDSRTGQPRYSDAGNLDSIVLPEDRFRELGRFGKDPDGLMLRPRVARPRRGPPPQTSGADSREGSLRLSGMAFIERCDEIISRYEAGEPMRDIAASLHIEPGHASSHRRIQNLHSRLRDKVAAGEISGNAALILARIPREHQVAIYEAVERGETSLHKVSQDLVKAVRYFGVGARPG